MAGRHEKMLRFSSHQGHTNKNHNEVLPHTQVEWLSYKNQKIINACEDLYPNPQLVGM